MVDPVLGRFHKPQSLAALTRGRGWNSELVGFLLPFARQDYIYQEYDFLESAITEGINKDWTVDNSSGTGAANFATTANHQNGVITGDTGTDDNGGIVLHKDAIDTDAATNPGIHIIMQIDDVSEAAMEVGYSDARSTETTLAVTDIDTPTLGNGVTDGAFIVYDTDSDTPKGVNLVSGGATDGDGGVALGTDAAANPLEDATDFDLVLQVFANGAYGIVNHNLSNSGGLSVGPDAATLMRPSIVVMTRNGTAKFPAIDLIRLWRERLRQ